MAIQLHKLFTVKTSGYARRWPRILMNEPARVTLVAGETRQVMLVQVSAGGARVAAHERLRPGDVVVLDFKLTPSDHHSIDATVIYAIKESKGFQWICGLSFATRVGDKKVAAFVDAEQQRRKIGFAMPRA